MAFAKLSSVKVRSAAPLVAVVEEMATYLSVFQKFLLLTIMFVLHLLAVLLVLDVIQLVSSLLNNVLMVVIPMKGNALYLVRKKSVQKVLNALITYVRETPWKKVVLNQISLIPNMVAKLTFVAMMTGTALCQHSVIFLRISVSTIATTANLALRASTAMKLFAVSTLTLSVITMEGAHKVKSVTGF